MRNVPDGRRDAVIIEDAGCVEQPCYAGCWPVTSRLTSVDMDTRGLAEIGIDIGGTFTDIVCRWPDGSAAHLKVPSSRAAPEQAVQDGIAALFDREGLAPHQVARFVHGTTVATNAVLERRGATLGLITSRGFRDVIEIGRQSRREIYDVIVPRQTPVFLCPRSHRRDVPERLAADGSVVVELDEAALADEIDDLVAAGVTSLAVAFLFSFLDPTHERRARTIALERHPDLFVSLSSDVDPSFREYERTAATAFDAYVKPVLDRYLAAMTADLTSLGIPAPLQVMQSRGGVCIAAVARERPIRLFLSGPAAGVVGGRDVAAGLGIADLITVDIGGTSCDVALVAGGEPLVRGDGIVDGFPVRVPMIDVNSVGSGGGSIAWVDGSGALRVGPRSAGSDPGPACYGRGGAEPTVTDASLVLGYIDPNYFAGGSIALDAAAAARAISAHIAVPLGLSLVDAALGIHRVVNAQMAEAIRLVSIHRGYDPREFCMVPLGGAGPLHATALAAELGITRIVVPANPGVLSAAGLLAAPLEHEVFEGFGGLVDRTDAATLRDRLATLDARAATLMARENASEAIVVQHSADMCFVGQSYYLDVPIPDQLDHTLLEALYEAFLMQHARVYGHSARNPAMIANLRTVHRSAPPARPTAAAKITSGTARKGTRSIRCAGVASSLDAGIFDRAALRPDCLIDGPAIVEQSDTTLLIEPGWRARVADGGTLLVERIAT